MPSLATATVTPATTATTATTAVGVCKQLFTRV